MQKPANNGRPQRRHSLKTSSGWRPRCFSHPIRPGEAKPASAEGQGLGAPSVDRQGELGLSAQDAGERLDGRKDGQTFAHRDGRGCSAGRFRIHSAMASFMRGASVRPPGEALASWREGGADARAGSSPWHRSQARQVLRAGVTSPLRLATRRGHLGRRRGCRPAPGCQCPPAGPEAFSSRLSGCTPLREIQPTLARPADLRLLSPETSPCLSVLGSLGTRRSSGHKGSSIPQCPSYAPTSYGHLGPWPGCGVEGSGRRT